MMESPAYFYWNLHKKCWSVMIRGKVEQHAAGAQLLDVEFRVRPGGHARVLREGRKNVHAFAVSSRCSTVPGEWTDPDTWPGDWYEVTYNPFKAAHFMCKCHGTPVTHADRVILTHDRRVFAQGLR